MQDRSGDAVATWLSSCQGMLFGFLRGMIGDSETARDLMQAFGGSNWMARIMCSSAAASTNHMWIMLHLSHNGDSVLP